MSEQRIALELARAALVKSFNKSARAQALAAVERALAPPADARVYELGYPPSANAYWRSGVKRGKFGKLIPYTYPTDEAEAYKGTVSKLGVINGWKPADGEVEVGVDVWRPRKVGDLDNCLKILFDAIKGSAFVDDRQVVRIVANRHDDADDPRATVTVRLL